MNKRQRYYKRPYQPRSRKKGGGFGGILLTLLIFLILGAVIVSLPVNRQPRESATGSVYVIDGDTVILNKVHIRLLGIDAPEMEQTCRVEGSDYACGRDARNALKNRIGKAAIRCEKEGFDKYGRDLGRCYLGDRDLNQWMVEQGWAVSYGDYRSAEASARREKRGIWAGSFEMPFQWRREHQKPNAEPETGHEAPSTDVISGTINYIKDRLFSLINSL
ncbi:thermonuclease family protein [Brucella pseudogrignonensis]|jgi:endonuclease YncB( thermonuclease family)|uniref:thermonuclease family protein n=1 Tax=Brucella pseudogrignonensis TaxID=419475 RepID=UPI000DDC2375|nr:thermonuclease family protein [Brucella pseudogrignonensis]MCD4511351.1 thermonuclease family protein [Brucella pseudogrignonensis]